MKFYKYIAVIFFIFIFLYPPTILASGFLILEVQTTGAGGSYDEFVKIQNNTGQTINLSGYKLQSQGSNGGNWINRTGTDGLPSLTVGSNQTFIIASKDYSGGNEIYRHTARWGLSDAAGGVKFLDSDGNALAEEHWSESPGLVIFHQPVASAVPPAEEDAVSDTPSEITPVPESGDTPSEVLLPPEPESSVLTEPIPETPTPAVTPSDLSADLSAVASAEAEATRETDTARVVADAPPAGFFVADAPQNDDNKITKTAKAGEETAVISNPAPVSGHNPSIIAAKKLKNDSKVKVRGVVSVVPGVLGSQIFYLSGSGIQVYMFKKDFPDLKAGDTIDIEGILSEAYGEKRIKLASRDSIKLVSSGAPPAPQEITANEIGESLEGSLVKISGEIIEIKKDYWYLVDGDSSQGGSQQWSGKEIKVLLKEGANIPADLVKAGDKVEITGIVSQYNKEYRLLPRSADDINILQPAVVANSAGAAPQNQKSKGFGVKDYLFVGLPAVLVIGLIVARKKLFRKNNSAVNQPPTNTQ